MNLGNVIAYDYGKKGFKIDREKAHQPNETSRPRSPTTVREHVAPQRNPKPVCPKARRSFRQGGREMLVVLRARLMSFAQISRELPDVPASTLQVRLSKMVAKGDVQRSGEFRNYRYTVAST